MPTKEKYIDLLTDFGFKKLFGTKANEDLLIDFLNQILPPSRQIQKINFSKNEQLGESEFDRIAIFDIFCQGENGEEFIVEIQRQRQLFFKDRSILYSTFPIQQNAKKGKKWNFELPPIYTIALLDFVFDEYKDDPNYIHHIELKDKNGKVFYNKLKYIYIELPKFTKKLEELETHFEKWLFVLRWINKLQKRPRALQERIFKKIFTMAEIAKYDKKERARYDRIIKQHRDSSNVLEYAVNEGIEKGRERGREEQLFLTIQNALKADFSLAQISIITNLSIEKLEEIIQAQKW